MESSGISVVVPTYNCKDILRRTLFSLCNQSLDRNLYEVIVVDDGSSDGTNLLVDEFRNKINLKYYFQDDMGFRVAKARNMGIENASHRVVLFFDAGMVASSKMLEKHYLAHQRKNNLVVLALSYGVYEYDAKYAELIVSTMRDREVNEALRTLSTMPELYDCRTNYLTTIDFRLERMSIPWILFWAGQVSVSTQALRFVGGFDEWFQSWGGEDVELGLRLHRNKCRFELLPDVDAIHYPHPKDPDEKKRNAANNARYIHEKHQSEATKLLSSHNWEEIVSMPVNQAELTTLEE